MQKMVDAIGDGYVDNIEIEQCSLSESTNMSRSLIDEDDLNLQIATAIICKSGTTNITGVLISASWEWAEGKPSYRGKDAIAINWNYNVFSYEADTFYAVDVYKSNASDDWR